MKFFIILALVCTVYAFPQGFERQMQSTLTPDGFDQGGSYPDTLHKVGYKQPGRDGGFDPTIPGFMGNLSNNEEAFFRLLCNGGGMFGR